MQSPAGQKKTWKMPMKFSYNYWRGIGMNRRQTKIVGVVFLLLMVVSVAGIYFKLEQCYADSVEVEPFDCEAVKYKLDNNLPISYTLGEGAFKKCGYVSDLQIRQPYYFRCELFNQSK